MNARQRWFVTGLFVLGCGWSGARINALDTTPSSPQSASASGLTASQALPLTGAAWTSVSFRNIRANSVDFADQQLRVKVQASASPLIHALPQPARVTAIRVQGRWSEEQAPRRKPLGFDDDSLLRVGLVIPGARTLSGPRRWLAADWVKTLFELAPRGSGIDRIEFLMFSAQPELMGKERRHPVSDLLRERIMGVQPPVGRFDVTWTLPQPIETAAIWLSSDGDDTGASFTLSITRLELTASAN